ncbi:MAG: hypothetical protein ABSG98_00305 [Anaerolineales bacterium]|jgi:hypothetical protein
MDLVEWKWLSQIVRTIAKPGHSETIDPVQEETVRESLRRIQPLLASRERFSIAEELAWLWRTRLYPLAMNPRFKREWDLFFALEVGYFYPLRKGKRPPGNPGQTGVLLANRQYLALVVADGDALASEPLLEVRFDQFWQAIIPQVCVVPYSTVRYRIDRGLQLLAFSLNQWRSSPATPPFPRMRPLPGRENARESHATGDACGTPPGSW